MKLSLDKIKSRSHTAEEKISEIENMAIKLAKMKQTKNIGKQTNQRLSDL